jgi:hypothetical protein
VRVSLPFGGYLFTWSEWWIRCDWAAISDPYKRPIHTGQLVYRVGPRGGWHESKRDIVSMTQPQSRFATRRRLVAAAMLVIGGVGICGAGVLFEPAWQAAHGGGRLGAFTLTEAMTCDRYQPPQQRCGWFGDFVSDDGTVVRHHMELNGGLPAGARIGDTVRARDTGGHSGVFREGDTGAWKNPAIFLAGFSGAFIVGVVLLVPWRRRARSSRGGA